MDVAMVLLWLTCLDQTGFSWTYMTPSFFQMKILTLFSYHESLRPHQVLTCYPQRQEP